MKLSSSKYMIKPDTKLTRDYIWCAKYQSHRKIGKSRPCNNQEIKTNIITRFIRWFYDL